LQRGSWAGSGDTLDKKFGTYLEKVALDAYQQTIGVDVIADTQVLPANAGDKVIFKRYVKKARQTTAITAGTNAVPTARSVQTIEASLQRFGGAEDIDKETLQTAVANLPEDIVKMFGIEAAESSEELVFQTISKRQDDAFMRLSTKTTPNLINHKLGVTSAVQSSVATKTLISADLTQTTNTYWQKALVTPLEGANAGITRTVTTFNSATNKLVTNTAWEFNIAGGIRFVVCRNVGHAANTENLGSATIKLARMLLGKNGAIPFGGSFENSIDSAGRGGDAPRGDFIAVLTPEVYMDVFGDGDFKVTAQQGDSWKMRLGRYQVARFFGINFHEMSLAWRTTAPTVGVAESNTYQPAGVVHCSNFVGQHAVAMVKPGGYGGKGKSGLKIYVKRPGPTTTEQSNDAFVRLGWDMYFGRKVLNGAWGITVLSSASN
jgi:hypothetical protein